MSDSEQEKEGNVVPEECTEADVFQSIHRLEDQANGELIYRIDYCRFWLGEGFGEACQDLTKEDYEPVIKRALGIRHFAVEDSPEDRAFAERHSTSWSDAGQVHHHQGSKHPPMPRVRTPVGRHHRCLPIFRGLRTVRCSLCAARSPRPRALSPRRARLWRAERGV